MLVSRQCLILSWVNRVVQITRFTALTVRAVDVRFEANLLGLTLHRLGLVVEVVLFEQLVCW